MKSRRQIALVTLFLLSGLMMACAPAATTAPAGAPRPGGTLNTIIHTDKLDRDLHQSDTAVSLYQLAPVYSTLIKIDPADPMKLVPDLAEKWEMSGDAKAYTFRLRQGVKFSDGTPLTSADVKANYDRIIWPPKDVVSIRKARFASVERVEAPDDYTVVFKLKLPRFAFLDAVASPWNVIFPKRILEAKGHMKDEILGSGPFVFKEYVTGVSTEVVKNPDYFMKGQPYLDGVKYYIIKDPTATQSAFRTGQLDLTFGGNGPIMAAERKVILQALPDTIVNVVPDTLHMFLMPNHKYKPWDDVRVRQAVSLTLDRRPFIDIAYQGDADLGGYMLSGFWSLPKEQVLKLPGYRYPKDQDIAEAKRLLAEAGYPGGFKTKLMTSSTLRPFADSAVLVKDQLSKIGVDVTIELYDTAKILQTRFERKFDTLVFGTVPASIDPDAVLGDEYLMPGALNFASYSNPRFDELFEKASQTMDPVARQALIRQMEGLLFQDVPRVVLVWRKITSVNRPYVKGFVQGPGMLIASLDFRDVWLAR